MPGHSNSDRETAAGHHAGEAQPRLRRLSPREAVEAVRSILFASAPTSPLETAWENRCLTFAARTALVMAAAQTVIHLVNWALWDRWFLNVNSESTAFSWLTSVLLFGGAFSAFLAARASSRGARSYLLLAGMLAFLSLDEHVQVHERVGGTTVRTVGLSEAWDSVVWPLMYVPLLGGIFILLIAVRRDGGARVSRFILVGLGLLAGAVVAEIVSAPWSTGDHPIHQLEGALEEGLEVVAWTLIAAALTTIAVRRLTAVRAREERRAGRLRSLADRGVT